MNMNIRLREPGVSTNKHIGVYCLVQLGFLETKTFKYPQYDDLSRYDFRKQYGKIK